MLDKVDIDLVVDASVKDEVCKMAGMFDEEAR